MPIPSSTAERPAPSAQRRSRRTDGSALPFTGFRPDIQGLRAVAVGVVLLYHAGLSALPGGFVGVDVFFVISGYLITGLLLKEALTSGRISLADFYAKRARRILPAATIVLLVTLVMTWLFLPQIRWEQIGIEAAGAAVYIVNWILAENTDYLNADVAPSPLQHFWTLSVEEQFYIIWPLLLIAAVWFATRLMRRGGARPGQGRLLACAGAGIVLILIPSFIWSVHYTGVNSAPAYFVTTTRLWELAIGAALAVSATWLSRMPHWLGYLLGWAGLAGIIAASVWYTSGSPAFPGSAALLPTLSTAAVIAGGLGGRAERGVGRLLGLKPMRWIGDISYSLYLWHWPLIVVGTYLLGGELRFRWGLAIVLFAIVPAWLSYRFIENPFRDWKRLKTSAARSLTAGAGLVTITLLCAAAIVFVPRATAAPTPSADDIAKLGAEKLVAEAQKLPNAVGLKTQNFSAGDTDTAFSDKLLESFDGAGAAVDVVEGGYLPSAIDARDDNPVIYAMGCQLDEEQSKPKPCVFGDETSDTTIMLVGDSHAASWMPALEVLAKKQKWKLVTNTKSGCSFSDVPQTRYGDAFPGCDTWNRLVLKQILKERPDLVVTLNMGRRGVWQNGASLKGKAKVAAFGAGLRSHWSELNRVGIPVRVIKDTPEIAFDVPECVSANPRKLSKCAMPRDEALNKNPHPEIDAVKGLPKTELIDMNDWICPDREFCAPVVGNVLVWRDTDHLTATFSRTLAEPLGIALLSTQRRNGKW